MVAIANKFNPANPPLFALGQTVITRSIQSLISEGKLNPLAPIVLLSRHVRGDWSELDADDRKMNEEAVRTGDDRIFSVYTLEGIKLYVITEYDRSVTTILLPEDY